LGKIELPPRSHRDRSGGHGTCRGHHTMRGRSLQPAFGEIVGAHPVIAAAVAVHLAQGVGEVAVVGAAGRSGTWRIARGHRTPRHRRSGGRTVVTAQVRCAQRWCGVHGWPGARPRSRPDDRCWYRRRPGPLSRFRGTRTAALEMNVIVVCRRSSYHHVHLGRCWPGARNRTLPMPGTWAEATARAAAPATGPR
jgi:hypothetical protein